ncbi:MAG: methyltransferase domain-containing protein [Candidatus Neomarinimicrobiota bacterium]
MNGRRHRLKTTPAHTPADIRAFFDSTARNYTEQHGDAEKLLRYRITLIKSAANIRPGRVVLDIGCGPGHHLLAICNGMAKGVGIDFSPAMIEAANRRLAASFPRPNVTFQLDNSEELRTVPDQSVNVALCVGALEHMVDQSKVLKNVHRVLKPGGRFLCLTPNSDYVWYSRIAPALGKETRHLSTDRFLTREELLLFLLNAGFERVSIACWTFIPKGDMHLLTGMGLQVADAIGRIFNLNALRGGLLASGSKPYPDVDTPDSFSPTKSL